MTRFMAVLVTLAFVADGTGEITSRSASEADRSPTAAPSGIFFPRLPESEVYAQALDEGDLHLDDGCLWLQTPRGRKLLLWPAGSYASEEAGVVTIRSATGLLLGMVGARIEVVGGEVRDIAVVRQLIGGDPPTPCRSGPYFTVGEARVK